MKKIIIILVAILVLIGFVILITNNYDLTTKDGRIDFAKSYVSWFEKSVKNSVNVIGYAIKLDWLPKN